MTRQQCTCKMPPSSSRNDNKSAFHFTIYITICVLYSQLKYVIYRRGARTYSRRRTTTRRLIAALHNLLKKMRQLGSVSMSLTMICRHVQIRSQCSHPNVRLQHSMKITLSRKTWRHVAACGASLRTSASASWRSSRILRRRTTSWAYSTANSCERRAKRKRGKHILAKFSASCTELQPNASWTTCIPKTMRTRTRGSWACTHKAQMVSSKHWKLWLLGLLKPSRNMTWTLVVSSPVNSRVWQRITRCSCGRKRLCPKTVWLVGVGV